MRIVFLGTPEFAINCLDALCKSKHEIVAVVTQPDKPSERGNKIQFSPVKIYAMNNNIPLFQFPKISRDGVVDLTALHPDIMITVAYGQILSQAVLDIAKYGVINVHASLLPKYRGASPIQTAIMRGDTETGVTIMQTDIGLDTGDILGTVSTEITSSDTAGDLSNRLSTLGANLLLEVLEKIENGTIEKFRQEHISATITKKITKADCFINWNKSTREIKCLIHSANPSPYAHTNLEGEPVKLLRAKEVEFKLEENALGLEPGVVLETSSAKNGLFVRTGDGAIEIVEMQLAGGKVLPAKAILSGRKIKPLDKFGN